MIFHFMCVYNHVFHGRYIAVIWIRTDDLLITCYMFFDFQAPDDDYFSVHIRRVGDWTEALAKACHVDGGEIQEAKKMPVSVVKHN